MHAAQSYGMTDNSLPVSSQGPRVPGHDHLQRRSPQAGVSNRYFYTDLPLSALWGSAGLARSSVRCRSTTSAPPRHPAVAVVRRPGVPGREPEHLRRRAPAGRHPRRAGLRRRRRARLHELAPVQARRAVHHLRRVGRILRSRRSAARARPAPEPRSRQDFGQMGFRIPAVVVSPYARRGHVDHSIYGFESIIKMIRYRYGLPPLTPRDLYANNIAAAFDFVSKPDYAIPDLPTPPEVIVSACAGTFSGRLGRRRASTTAPLGAPPGTVPSLQAPERTTREMLSSGYLERLGLSSTSRPPRPRCTATRPSSGCARDTHAPGRARYCARERRGSARRHASLATADSFTPVQLTIAVRAGRPPALAAGDHRRHHRRSRRALRQRGRCGSRSSSRPSAAVRSQTTPGTTLRQLGALAPAGYREVLLGRCQGLGPALRLRRTDGVRVPGGHRHQPGLRQ